MDINDHYADNIISIFYLFGFDFGCFVGGRSIFFVKMNFHPETKSVSIHVFADDNEAESALWKHHGKDVYLVEDDKIRKCDLHDNQIVQVGPSYTVPIGHTRNISIRIINIGLIALSVTFYLDFIDWDVNIKEADDGKFSVRYCASTDTNFDSKIKKQVAAQFKKHDGICENVEGGRSNIALKALMLMMINRCPFPRGLYYCPRGPPHVGACGLKDTMALQSIVSTWDNGISLIPSAFTILTGVWL